MDMLLDRPTPFELFKKYQVEAESVADFLEKYYKKSRSIGRGKEYANSLLNDYLYKFDKDGYIFISHHDSKTGEVVSFYGKEGQNHETNTCKN